MANCSSDASFPNDDFSELLWDNGPVVLQAPWKSPLQTTYRHIEHFRPIEPKVNLDPLSGFSAGFGVPALEDNVDPWNYAVEESLRNVYCPENLTDYSGINPNCVDSGSRRSSQANRGSNDEELGNGSDPSRVIPGRLFQLPQQFTKSRTIGSGFGGTDNADEDQDGEGLKSPTHFSPPPDLGKREESNNKATSALPSDPLESILIESRSGLKSSLENQDRPVLKPSELELGSSPKSPQAARAEDTYRKNDHKTTGNLAISPDQIQSSSLAWSAVIERHETGKDEEAALASSGSNVKTASYDHNHREKRTRHKGEELFGYQSEDVEGESVLKKSRLSRGKSTKRNRAAEVHNLSERRRRDRINEKMRALQELIPNCNKTDKASMLDDAIEYLKKLQMQLQIMSTGGGLCIHPMMMKQHVRAATMPHFLPMSVGMGPMGFGMGMYKMNGSPLFCHFAPVAPFHHFPGSSILPILENPGQRFNPMSTAHRGPATRAPCPTNSSPATTLSSKDRLKGNTSSEKIQKSSASDPQNC